MNNPVIIEDAQMTGFQDYWLIARSKAPLETKAQIKKAATAEQKLTEKREKAYKKAWSKNQSLNMRRLAISNSNVNKIGTFKDILSDPPIKNSDNLIPDHKKYTEAIFSDTLVAVRLKNIGKKR